MKNIISNFALGVVMVFLFTTQVNAEMMLFVGDGCAYCENLEDFMGQYDIYDKFDVKRFEIYYNEENKYLYAKKALELGYTTGKIPFLVNGDVYVDGDKKIIAYFQKMLGTNKVEPTVLNPSESQNLNAIIKDRAVADDANKSTKIIGLIVIIFGLTFFTTIIRRGRRKK